MAAATGDSQFRPKKRRRSAKHISYVIFFTTVALVIGLGCYLDLKYSNAAKIHKKALPTIMATNLVLLGIIIGTLVGNISLFAVEQRRYGGQKREQFKACVSGIRMRLLVFFVVVSIAGSVLIYLIEDNSYLDSRYVLYIVGGIGVWPFVMDLLQNNEKSVIKISSILEETETRPSQIIAWNYYLNDIRHASLEFDRVYQTSCLHKSAKLSCNKLLLLVSLSCSINENLEFVDNNIKKYSVHNEREARSRYFSVYRMKVDGRGEKYYAIKNVKEPLQTLKRMGALEEAKAVTKDNLEEELKTFYFKLSEILDTPPEESSRKTFILVPIMEKNLRSLNNGGLAKYIMDAVQRSESTHVYPTTWLECMEDRPRQISSEPGCSFVDV